MSNRLALRFAVLLLSLCTAPSLLAELSASLTPSERSPAPLGTTIVWSAAPAGSGYWYRFSVRGPDAVRTVVKDFGPDASFTWASFEREGLYEIQVEIRHPGTGETAQATRSFQFEPHATPGGTGLIRPTVHPLVFLYSAPSCTAGSVLVVYYIPAGGGDIEQTSTRNCDGVSSVNLLIAGLLPDTPYLAKHVVFAAGGFADNPPIPFTSGAIPDDLPVHRKVSGQSGSPGQKVQLAASLFTHFVATDLDGNVIWYYPETALFLTSVEVGGRFLAIHEDERGGKSRQIMRVFDLTGTTVQETNAARVSEQLVAMGKLPISAFHHDARRASNGNLLVLASVEQILSDVQGPGPVNILGDMIIELNPDLEVVWTWDSFDHLDVRRMATQGDLCGPQSCPPLFLAPVANDWVHGNSLSETADGSLLYSARSQDWVIKIDYQRGKGGGNVLWRLGIDGDFQISSGDPDDWFSHQHDAEMERDGTLSLFDNSNLRNAENGAVSSRGQVFRVDEGNRRAEIVLNADLGYYSFALGSAQLLDNGNYSFDAGFRQDGTGITVEVNSDGEVVYQMESSAPEYRTFRLRNLYTP